MSYRAFASLRAFSASENSPFIPDRTGCIQQKNFSAALRPQGFFPGLLPGRPFRLRFGLSALATFLRPFGRRPLHLCALPYLVRVPSV